VENVRERGRVKWFDSARGHGFLVYDGNAEGIFCHHSHIEMDGYRSLSQGQEVEFEIEQSEKGFHAVRVVPKMAATATK
jgi:CspA family cold shock protein